MESFLNPPEVLKKLELRKNMVAADFGSGSGGWVLPLARRLTEGKVYAIDVLPEALSVLESRSRSEKLFNIQIVCSNLESKRGSTLHPNSVDLVLMTNLLFEVDDKKRVIEEGKRVLKKGGNLLVVDWKTEASVGPENGRISAKDVKEIAEDLDLKLEKEFDAGSYHYGLVFIKP